MSPLESFHSSWIQFNAAQATEPELKYLLVPVLLMFFVTAATFLLTTLRKFSQHLPTFNFILCAYVAFSFQACGEKHAATPPISATGITPAVPNINLDDYSKSGTNPTPGYENIRLFVPTRGRDTAAYAQSLSQNSNNAQVTVWGGPNSNIKNTVVAECLHYNALLGKSVTTSGNNKRAGACDYIRTWEDFPGDQNSPPSVGARNVLNSCRGSGNRLAMDLSLRFSENNQPPLIRTEANHPFTALVYCVRTQGANVTIQMLNPALLTYEILSETPNNFTSVSRLTENPGWFVGSFSDYKNGRVAEEVTTIRLAANQGTDPDQGAATPLDPTNIPSMKVLVLPEGLNAGMGDLRMMTTLTDALQEPLRGSPRVAGGIVNPANGEVVIAHTDLEYPLVDTSLALSVRRTYRSLNNHIGDFGYNWDWISSREFYSFATPLGAMGTYEFLRTGEGRLVATDEGPFWSSDEEDQKPSLQKALLLFNRGASLFDLSGRLVSLYDTPTGNRLYYFNHNGGVAIIADQNAVRSNLQPQVSAYFALLNGYNPSNPLPTQINQASIQSAFLSKPGNFLFIIRNLKGYVQAIVDKTGNMTWYTYGDAPNIPSPLGDHLLGVTRYVTQSAASTGRESESLNLYNYEYDSSFGRPFTGLINKVTTSEINGPTISAVSYAQLPVRFGSQPQVSALTVLGESFTFSYDYEHVHDSENPYFTTKVTDFKGDTRSSLYHFNPAGYLIKKEGPTETQNRAVLEEYKWDPKLLQVTNVISRGVERVLSWNRESGALTSTTLCADRDESENLIVARLDDEGCTNSNLQRTDSYTLFNTEIYYLYDWFADLSANLTPAYIEHPSTGLNGNQSMSELFVQAGCFGGRGLLNTNGFESGTYCSYSVDPNGGNILFQRGREEFEDGTEKKSVMISPQARADSVQTPYPNPENLPWFSQTNQSYFYTQTPTAGATSVYSPEGVRGLTAVSLNFYDAYGNVIANKHAWGSETHFYYDYRKPRATLILSRRGVQPKDTGSSGIFANALRVVNTMRDEGTPINENRRLNQFSNEVTQAFSSADATDLILLDRRLDPQMRTAVEYSDSSKTIKTYDPIHGLPAQMNTYTRKRFSPNVQQLESLALSSSVTYDHLRPSYILNADGTSIQNTFGRPDGGVSESRADKRATGGAIEVSRGVEWDHAGRVIRQRLDRSGVTTQAPATEFRAFAYSPFGEVIRTSVSLGDEGGSQGQSLSTANYDLRTGVKTRESSQSTGPNLRNETFVTEYDDFDRQLRPRTVRDLARGKEVHVTSSSVPGKELVTETFAPTEYGGSGRDLKERKTTTFDGCGNTITNTVQAFPATDIQRSRSIVQYGSSPCIVSSVETPTGWKVLQGYLTDATPVVTDDFNVQSNGEANLGDRMIQLTRSLSRCETRDAFGRCQVIPTSYSFQASGAPGQLELPGDVQMSPMIIHGANVSVANSLGTELFRRDFVGKTVRDSVGTQQTQFRVTSALDTRIDNASSGTSFGTSDQTQRPYEDIVTNVNSFGKNLTTWTLRDPVLGSAWRTVKNKWNSVTAQYESSAEVSTIDSYGRAIATSHYVGTSSGSYNAMPSLKAANLVSSMNIEWQSGNPYKITVQRPLGGSNNVTETLQHLAYLNGTEQPSRTELRARYTLDGQIYEPQAVMSFSADGLKNPKTVEYNQTAPAAYRGLSLVSHHDYERDSFGRIISENVWLQDRLDHPNENRDTYPVASENIPRLMATSANEFQVTYDYHTGVPNQPYGFTMNYDNFHVTYALSKSDGPSGDKILSITVRDPSGRTHTWRQNGSIDATDPYKGLKDSSGTVGAAGNLWAWFENLTGQIPKQVAIRNIEYPRFAFATGDPQIDMRVIGIESNKDTLDKIGLFAAPSESWWFELLGFGAFSNGQERIENANGSIRRTRPPGNYGNIYSCDNAGADISDTYFGGNFTARYATRFVDASFPEFNNPLRPVFGNDFIRGLPSEKGQPMRIRRSHHVGSQGARRSFIFDVVNAYDGAVGSAVPAASEEIIWYRDASRSGGGDWFGGQIFRVLRLTQTRRYIVASPNTSAFARRELILKEVINDHKASHLGANERERAMSPAPLMTGTRYNVWGPDGPIFSFYQRNGEWVRIDHISDEFGNVKATREWSPSSGYTHPTQNEMFMPYLSSIVADYGHTELVTEGQTKLYRGERPSSDDSRNMFSSFDPEKLPLQSRFGASGAPRDIAGMSYAGTVPYDTWNGELIAPAKDLSRVCVANTSMLNAAQSFFDSARASRRWSVEGGLSPSINYEMQVAEMNKQFSENAPWIMQSPFGEGPNYAAAYWFNKRMSTNWYFEKNSAFGSASAEFVQVAGFFTCDLEGLYDSSEYDSAMGQGLSIAMFAQSCVPF